MSNIQKVFDKMKVEGHKAFIPFITAGDPHIDATESFIYALEEAGSTIIELGIPFSDPVADGPVIQRANLRAMAKGVTLHKIFEMVSRVRKKTDIPLVFLMYANTIHYYGTDHFFKKCQDIGIDGVIIPDVPLEEKEEFACHARERGVDLISLVTPTSKERTKAICQDARGFLYCVSSLGVTGTRENIETNLGDMFESIKAHCMIPTALGFGISTPKQALELKDYTDGIIVGSEIVKIIEEHGDKSGDYLKVFVTNMLEVLTKSDL
ncbi:tryptophan synthase subunit alpha [Sporanaerobium hydrogeniformans]|uniref:Tryptophan synthase subunit alpha n=1 Tax=Sporanaerobium hydrogeniformans TaxID=3072179 RepID=A0AC61DBS3_9FIRM|nr:tryptophan synthase subunit alpha [Sporanaerobium hydrogeniformans]PHV70228.1 tryptophan synthase subunit alpha [Sporanaerobium hydrogeniformans]